MNASSLTAPKVFQSLFRTVVMLANASTRHGHTPQGDTRLPLTISSMWVWGLSCFNLTLLFQPQASGRFLRQMQGVVGV